MNDITMEKRYNILFISSWYPCKNNKFSGNFVRRHAQAISIYANIWVVHVCFYERTKEYIDYNYTDGVHETILYLPRKQNPIPIISLLYKFFIIKKKYNNIIQSISSKYNIKFDIIHANVTFPIGIMAYIFSKKLNIPYIITEHWTGYTPEDKKSLSLSKLLISRWIVKNSNNIITVSKNLKISMQKLKIDGNYTVIPNAVDTKLFAPKQHNKDIIRFIHISTLNDKQKNISGILRSTGLLYKKRNDFALQITGNGDISEYKSMCKKLGLDDVVTIQGATPIEEIAEQIRQSDVLLLFSNYENSPCVISEALCVGLPVISTNVGGISEMINIDNGILIEPQNEKLLCEKMNYMIENYNSYNIDQIRKNAIQEYSYTSVGRRYFNIYNRILKHI